MSANGRMAVGRCLKQLQQRFSSLGKSTIIVRQNERTLHSMHQEISGLFIHHLVAKLKEDVICLTFPPMINQIPSHGYLWCFLHRLYFTLKKKAPAMSMTVSPCDFPIEWSLAARTLKDKPLKSLQCERTRKNHKPHLQIASLA